MERLVICLASPPLMSMVQSWVSPEREDSNRIRLPSGLQRGCLSFLSVEVSLLGGFFPATSASQRLEEDLFASRSTLVTTYAIQKPSGLICASETRRNLNRSSTCMGRAAVATVAVMPRIVINPRRVKKNRSMIKFPC